MKKIGAVIASFTLILVLAGCGAGNQNKTDMRNNLSGFRNDNEMSITLDKFDTSEQSGGKTTKENLKKYLGENPKITVKMDRKNKIAAFDAAVHVKDFEKTDFKFITDGSQFLMGAKVFGDIVKSQAGSAGAYFKQANIDKLGKYYLSLDEAAGSSSKDMETFKKAFLSDKAWESDKKTVNENLDELLKDVEVTKDDDGYLKASLNKKDVEKYIDASDDKDKKADAKKELKDFTKLNITLLSKGHELITTVKMESKDKEKATVKFTITGKKTDVSLTMPSAKDVITATQLQTILLGKK